MNNRLEMPDRLWRIFSELASLYPKISLRGVGANCAIHLQNKGRVVDISEIKGGWWLEFVQEPDYKVRECLSHNKEELFRLVGDWLK